MRGKLCRYAHNDLEHRILNDLTRQGSKVRPETLRSGQVDCVAPSLPPNQPGENDEIAFGSRNLKVAKHLPIP